MLVESTLYYLHKSDVNFNKGLFPVKEESLQDDLKHVIGKSLKYRHFLSFQNCGHHIHDIVCFMLYGPIYVLS